MPNRLRIIPKLKGIVSQDFGWLQMIFMNRTRVPDVPLEVNFLLSALIKAEPRENLELKKLYENEKKKKIINLKRNIIHAGIHVMFIKIIYSHPKSRETIPLKSIEP